MQNGSPVESIGPVERLPIELDETLPYHSPQVREEGTLALRWTTPPGNQLIVMMMLPVLNAQREEKYSPNLAQGTIAAQGRLRSLPESSDLLYSLSWHCRARKTCIDDRTLALRNMKEAILFASGTYFRNGDSAWSWCGAITCRPMYRRRVANTWTALLLPVLLLSEYITAGSTENPARARECLPPTKSKNLHQREVSWWIIYLVKSFFLLFWVNTQFISTFKHDKT